MPIYEYRCGACDNTFSTLVVSSDTPTEDVVCPRCKEHRAEKLLSMKTVVISGQRSTAKALPCGAPAGSGFS